MKKGTKLLIALSVTAGLIYAGCRKMDRQTPPPGVTKEEKFFTFRKASDPLVQAITDYMQRQNEKLHYVEKTVNQIGYPYWDKAVIADTHAGAERGASGTSNIIYVPFVRDSENFVNASLVIHATPADTSFSYMCDWQYTDTTQTGMPKKAAALTMIRLDNAVFGNRLFQLTDSSLFGRSAKYMKLGSVTNNRGSLAGKPNTQAYVYSYTICWTEWEDQFEGQVHGCVPGPTCFEYNEVNNCLEISWTVGGDPSQGGGGGTGSGGSGTSGGGGSGSPGTGTPPPSPCGQTGGLRPGTATPCGAGWVPLPEGSPSANQNIIDSLQGFPCAQGILAQMISCNAATDSILSQVFGKNDKVNVIFVPDSNLAISENAVTKFDKTTFQTNGTVNFVIHVNTYLLKNGAKQLIAKTLIHESVHAYIGYYWNQYLNGQMDSIQFKSMFPLVWQYKNKNQAQHEQMVSSYFNTIKGFITGYSPSIADSVSTALTWNGLTWTQPWHNLGSDTTKYLNIYQTAKYGNAQQMQTIGLRKCN